LGRPLGDWLVAILLASGIMLANLSAAATTDPSLNLDQTGVASEDCSGSQARGHGSDCRLACGTHCQALLCDQTAAPPPRARHAHGMAAQGIGDRIGRPEPHPPKSRFA
jgi:hypothetical protein